MLDTQLRQTGIGVVGDVPWGTHFFLFHETKEDLIDACIPYFQAGLESRELCMWGIADLLTEEEVRYCLKHAIPGFEDHFESRFSPLSGKRAFIFGAPKLRCLPLRWRRSPPSARILLPPFRKDSLEFTIGAQHAQLPRTRVAPRLAHCLYNALYSP